MMLGFAPAGMRFRRWICKHFGHKMVPLTTETHWVQWSHWEMCKRCRQEFPKEEKHAN
jgi:hypothetical protein